MTCNNFSDDENRQLAFEHLQPQPIPPAAAGTLFPPYHHMLIYAPPPPDESNPTAQPPPGLPPYLHVAYCAALPPSTPPSPKSKTCENCGYLLCGSIISLNLLLFAFIVLQALLADWRELQFEIRSFSMLNYENAPNNSSKIKAKWELNMTVCNHKRITQVSFSEVRFTLNYKGEHRMDSASHVKPFVLNGMNENCEMMRVGFSLPSSNEAASEGEWMKLFEEDRRKNNNTSNIKPLSVHVEATVWYRIGTFDVIRYRLLVLCGDLPVDFRTPRGHRSWTGIQECGLFVD